MAQGSEYIGRVAITQKEPSTPHSFWVWISSNVEIPVGSLLVVEDPETPGSRILAVVDDVKSTSMVASVEQEFFSYDFGNPKAQVATTPTIVKSAHCQVVGREKPLLTPISARYYVRRATAQDIQNLLISRNIPEKNRILAGFVRVCDNDGDVNCWAPVYYHSDFILGPEGAHINISGITGLATKTSYAVFLAFSILSWAKEVGEKVAVIMFNVKRRDLMDLYNLPENWETAKKDIQKWGESRGIPQNIIEKNIVLWEVAKSLKVDPIELISSIRIFTYPGDPDIGYIPQEVNARNYSYGFLDLTRDEILAAIGRNLTEPMIALIDKFLEYINTQVEKGKEPIWRIKKEEGGGYEKIVINTFDNWLKALYNYSGPQEEVRTAKAVARRLTGFLARSKRVILRDKPHGKPIKVVTSEEPGTLNISEGLNIIQLHGLSEDEKRVVVNAVLREVAQALERRNANFKRAVFFIDELNKYAPRAESPIKELIVDIAARGRDLMLSLIGAEQFASGIDKEIYENASTKVIGRSGTGELQEPIYRYLLGFKEYATMLEKGEMIIYHPPIGVPLIVSFPIPLHEVRRS